MNPLRTTAPTEVSLRVTRDALRLNCWPPLLVDAVWPMSNVALRGVTWDLRGGQLADVDVENSQFAIPAAGFVERAVGAFVRSALQGTPLGRRGYDPFADPDLAGTLASVQANLSRTSAAEPGNLDPSQVDGVRLEAGITVTSAIERSTNDGGVRVPAGTEIDLSALLQGNAQEVGEALGAGRAPRGVQSLWMQTSGITLHQDGEDIAVLEQLSVGRGGRVDVHRFRALGDLEEAEGVESGLRGLVLLFQLAALRGGHNPGRLATNGSPEVVHGVAEGRIEEALTSAVQALLEENATAVPGVDLRTLFGVEPRPAGPNS